MTSSYNNSEIRFITVKDLPGKRAAIFHLIYQQFQENTPILITVPSEEAAQYLDHLLWGYLPESFIPHSIEEQPCKSPVVITTVMQNLNEAPVLLNLCRSAAPISFPFTTIYELWDETDPGKKQLSEERYNSYHEQGYSKIFK